MRGGDRSGPGALLALAAVLAACGAPGDDHLDVVFDPCGAVLTVPADASGAERASIGEAAAMWNAVLDGRLSTAPAGAPDALPIRFEEAAPLFRGVYLDEEGVVVINRKLTGDRQRAIAIAHELGHAFGLWHVEDRDSVMNPGNLALAPDPHDAVDLVAIWGRCPAD